jgi:hypothetical protein
MQRIFLLGETVDIRLFKDRPIFDARPTVILNFTK